MGNKAQSKRKSLFLSENILPIQESGQLKFVSLCEKMSLENSELGFGIFSVDGHTEKQMLPQINTKIKPLFLWLTCANSWTYSIALCYEL